MKLTQKARLLHRAWRYRLHAEHREISLVNSVLQPGDSVLDIGAHKAAFTYWMARAVGPSGHVCAFEPNPDLAGYLRMVSQDFPDARVEVVEAALSRETGTATLHFPGEHLGSASLELTDDELQAPISVATLTLDSFLNQSATTRPISFMKCDVEYHELAVLEGASGLLRDDKPNILVESGDFVEERFRLTPVQKYLEELGYQGFFFCGKALVNIDEFDPKLHPPVNDDHQNYVFVHPESPFANRLSGWRSHTIAGQRLAS